MALIPIKVSSNSEHKKYADPEISSPITRAKGACFSKATRNYLKQKAYRNQYLAEGEDFEYSDDLWKSFKSYLNSPPFYTDEDIIKGIDFYDKLSAVFTGEDGYEEGDILNATFKISNEVIRDFLESQEIIKEVPPPPATQASSTAAATADPQEPAATEGTNYHTVVINKDFHLLGLRATPGQISTSEGDLFHPDGPGQLDGYATGAGGIGALSGKLPIGTRVEVLLVGAGAGGAWSQVKVLDSPNAAENGKVGYVDSYYIQRLTSSGEEKIAPVATTGGGGAEQAILEVEDQLAEPTPVEIDGEEYHSLSEYVSTMEPIQDWRFRTPLYPFKNDKEKRFEMVVELDYFPEVASKSEGGEGIESYQDGKLEEARRLALKSLLRYYNRKSTDEYVLKLLLTYRKYTPQDSYLVEELEFYSDENPQNQKVLYYLAIPYKHFHPERHDPAVNLSVKELIKLGHVKYQMVFTVKEIKGIVDKLKDILLHTIKPGMDSYNGKIENAPDLKFQAMVLDEFIPALQEHFFINGVKFRDSEDVFWTDLVEIGLDEELKPIYIKFGPQDANAEGTTGQWRIGDE